MSIEVRRAASLLDACIPLAFLILSLFASVLWFGEDASYGPNQVVLMLAGVLVLLIGLKNGQSWRALEQELFNGMSVVFAPSFILLAVGIMVATWIAAGIVPSMIWFGLSLIHPLVFYATTCLVCALVSLSIGSSWTTAASVGVALIGTALGLGLSAEIAAGAVISGAYFGDKMSPLSETTNLASAVTEVDLFTHIRHMAWTGGPALLLALAIFLVLGFGSSGADTELMVADTLTTLEANFHIAWYMLLPLVLLLILAWRGMPALPAILSAALMGALYILLQPASDIDSLEALWWLSVVGYASDTGDTVLDDLLSGGGAAAMLNTIWLILSAVFFGGAMEKTGLLAVLVERILNLAKGVAGLISATVLSGISANIITGDQYISIVLPGRMFARAYRERGLAAVNLSRAIEDSATVTSPLVPWNTCGAFMAATLGVATLSYLPFCFFNLLMPLISIAYGWTGFKIIRQE